MENLIYLDNAATSWPKPDSVYDFMIRFYRECGVNPGRSGFDKAIEAGNIVHNLRERLTKFFGGDTDARNGYAIPIMPRMRSILLSRGV